MLLGGLPVRMQLERGGGNRYGRGLRRLDELLAEVQDELLAPLSPVERQQLIGLLNRILEHHA